MGTHANDTTTGYGFCNADGSAHQEEKGLTKREYFAAMGMQGLIANGGLTGYHSVEDHGYGDSAVNLADDLIKSLNKQP